MKKLVSAATSLVMAATMVGAVAPVVAGAADAKKGLTLQAYKNATLADGVKDNGSTVTVSADAIKAGDVTVPVGIYLNESTADLLTIGCGVTIKSDNAAAKNITLTPYQTKDEFFAEDKEYTDAAGTTFKTKKVVAFAGSYSARSGYQAAGAYQVTPSPSGMPEYGADNAYIGVGWNCKGQKYEWFGSKSDDYPLVVFDVTLPKGTAEGDYVVSFVSDAVSTYGHAVCMLEAATKYDPIEGKNLDLTNLTIKVGDSAANSDTTTTTSANQTTAATTTTATTAASSSSSSSSGNQDVSDAEIVLDFINPESEDGYWHAEAGEKELFVDMHITGKDETVKPTGFTIEFSIEGGITAAFEEVSPALDDASMSVNGPDLTISCGCPQADGHGTVINTENNVMAMMTLSVPADIADGLYEITATKTYITRDVKAGKGETYSVAVKPGYIAIGDVSQQTTTTSSSAATTAATTTTATTTASAATTASTGSSSTGGGATGTPLYGDTNCDKVVRINDVVLLNKYLNDNKSYAITEQGKLNADCYNPKDGKELTAEDSDAIIKSIVHLVELPVKK